LATGLAQCFGAGIPAPQHVPDEPVHGPAVDGDELMVDDDPYGFFEKAQAPEVVSFSPHLSPLCSVGSGGC